VTDKNLPTNRIQRSTLALFLSLSLAAFCPEAIGSSQRAPSRASQRNVRLVLGIVIDQLRYDYLTRFEDLFVVGGFRRLLRQGAVFSNANYNYVPTVTACAHATFMSGALPAGHGIVGNDWFERSLNREVTSVWDDGVKLLGGQGMSPASPARLIGSTIGDQLRLANSGKSKVIGIALKDRSAILTAGKNANGAYWFDTSSGVFVSSTYYFPELPEWVKRFNQNHRADRYFGARWDRLLPKTFYERSLPDDSTYEQSPWGKTFPHLINGREIAPGPGFYDQFDETPFANDYTVAFAKAAIEGERLGEDQFTDLLTVSFSANDGLGHRFGPYSQEVQDMTLRTDLTLANLLRYVDQRIGLANTVVVLTSDHGVAPIPEHARQLGLGGGRLASSEIRDAVQALLNERLGPDQWLRANINGNIYFDYEVITRRGTGRSEVERVACEAIVKLTGLADCYTRTQILSGQVQPGPVSSCVINGFNRERSGDVIYVFRPYHMTRTDPGTTHGTCYRYDTHVPVVLFGRDIAAGNFAGTSSPADIAPTLAALLKIEPPSSSSGRILTEAIRLR